MALFIAFVGLFMNIAFGGLLDEVTDTNIILTVIGSALYIQFLYTHLYERGAALIFFIIFFILFIIVGGIAKVRNGNMNFIGCVGVIDCILALVAFIMSCIGSPRFGFFY